MAGLGPSRAIYGWVSVCSSDLAMGPLQLEDDFGMFSLQKSLP